MKLRLELKAEDIKSKRGLQDKGKVQAFLDNEVIRLTEPYVPFQSGILKNTPLLSSSLGEVVYNTPYARRQYYENRGNGTDGTSNGGIRGKLWFERMKADRRDDIIKSVQDFVNRGG